MCSCLNSLQIYLTKYHALLPDCDAIFVHHALVQSGVFSGVNTDNHNVFMRFDIAALAGMLPTSLPEVDLRSGKNELLRLCYEYNKMQICT